jgi:glyoxylase-like metal-dependent hydrolase (beta-lactamase superfamily II)
MIFKQIKSGGDRNFSYLIACNKTKQGALIDPSPDPHMVMQAIKNSEIDLRFIINTHSHIDHSAGNEYFTASSKGKPINFLNSSKENKVKDGQVLNIGEISIKFITTPGHTPDSICIKADDKLVTGDTLFVGKVGGTWSEQDAKEEFESLKKIMALDPDTEVWPGHDYGIKPHSTIGFEHENNPFIKRLSDFDEFLWLKQNWTQYKNEHGIK